MSYLKNIWLVWIADGFFSQILFFKSDSKTQKLFRHIFLRNTNIYTKNYPSSFCNNSRYVKDKIKINCVAFWVTFVSFSIKKTKETSFHAFVGLFFVFWKEDSMNKAEREKMFSQYSDMLVCQCLALQLIYIKQKASVQRSDQIFKG